MASTAAIKKVGILTGGGDCPGLNAVIRGVSTPLLKRGVQIVGVLEGWRGMVENKTMPVERITVNEIVQQGGTILGSSRTNPYKNRDRDVPKVVETYKKLELDALVAVGGDDTLEIAYYLSRDHQLKIIGVPKTIDNDVPSTDFTFGFMSAVESATHDFDRLRTTAKSHRRVIVVECMGRHAGWIAAYVGLASQADFVAVPEKPCDVREIAERLKEARKAGKIFNLVSLAEGASIGGLESYVSKNRDKEDRDAFGNIKIAPGELCDAVARGIENLTGFETRYVALGHLQRGGSPCAFDRVLGSRYGLYAARAILGGRFGIMIAFENNRFIEKTLKGTLREDQTQAKRYKLLDADFIKDAEEFFG